jgi:calcium-translocating P-type ATPase
LFDFSSERKRMTTVARQSTSQATALFMKGAPEVILERSSFFYNMNGEVQEMTTVHRNKFQQDVDNMANKALRTLAIAMKELPSGYTREGVDLNELESNVVLLGIVGIEDPLRDGVTQSISECKGAGITVRMVTGDNVKTATEIATRCGILSAEGLVLEGPEFEKMTDQELEELLPRLQVLARSRPHDKLRLVQLLKAAGEIVAVTGDGTNDALALNEANIGLAMGIAGSSVAKEAADIIILDDNFLSIVKAVLWGRSIYNNIQKFLQFQLTVNLSALVVAVLAALSNYGTPLKALQLLWVNMIMDTLASLALCTERPNPELLNQKPFGKDGLLSRRLLRNVLCQGLYQITVLLIILYAGDAIWHFSSIGEYGVGNPRASLHYTFLFNTFVFFQIFNLLNARRIGDEKNVFAGITKDWVFSSILVGIIIVQVLVTTFGGFVFMTKSLPWDLWLISIGVGAVSLPLRYVFNLIPLSRTSARAYSRL